MDFKDYVAVLPYSHLSECSYATLNMSGIVELWKETPRSMGTPYWSGDAPATHAIPVPPLVGSRPQLLAISVDAVRTKYQLVSLDKGAAASIEIMYSVIVWMNSVIKSLTAHVPPAKAYHVFCPDSGTVVITNSDVELEVLLDEDEANVDTAAYVIINKHAVEPSFNVEVPNVPIPHEGMFIGIFRFECVPVITLEQLK